MLVQYEVILTFYLDIRYIIINIDFIIYYIHKLLVMYMLLLKINIHINFNRKPWCKHFFFLIRNKIKVFCNYLLDKKYETKKMWVVDKQGIVKCILNNMSQ